MANIVNFSKCVEVVPFCSDHPSPVEENGSVIKIHTHANIWKLNLKISQSKCWTNTHFKIKLCDECKSAITILKYTIFQYVVKILTLHQINISILYYYNLNAIYVFNYKYSM